MTRILPGDDPAAIGEAARCIRAGGLVAFPTETVYGLGGNALDPQAVARIFAAKGRPASDPLIVHLAHAGDLGRVARDLPAGVPALARAFWPGPLTLVVPRGPQVPLAVTSGRETVAARVPAHPVAHALLVAAGTPIAAPSANRFGHTSPTTAAHVLADLGGRIDLVLDGGPAPIGVESTVLDLTVTPPTILRPGGVTHGQLSALLGEVALEPRAASVPGEALPAPGMLERHYAPEARLELCDGPAAAAHAWLRARAASLQAAGLRVGLLIPDDDHAVLEDLGAVVELLGPASDSGTIAQRLYAAMRALDAQGVQVILARTLPDGELAPAIKDRLVRAASGHVTVLPEDKEHA